MSLLSRTQKAGLVAAAAVGAGIVAASVSLALVLPRNASVAVAAAGAALGTAVLFFAVPRFFAARDRERWVAAERDLRARLEELEARARESEHLRFEAANKDREIERLRRMAVRAESVEGIVELSLLRVEATVSDVVQTELRREAATTLTRGEIHEYVGVLDSRFTALLGVDLQALRVREDVSGALVVSGMRSKFQGLADLREDWKLKEVRIRKEGGLLPDIHVIQHGDPRLATLTIEQRQALVNRLQAGTELRTFDATLKGLAREYLKVVLGPYGRPVLFVDEDAAATTPLLEFVRQRNETIEDEIRLLEAAKPRLLPAADSPNLPV